MRRYNNSVITATGTAVAGALVVVKAAATPPGTGVLATIYSDDGITPTTNPLIADAFGRFGFNAPNGRYDLVVSGPNLVTFVMAGEEITDFLEFQAGKDQQPSTGAIVSVPTNAQIISGQFAVSSLNNVLYADQQPGADASIKLNNCIAALIARGGGTCDASGLVGSQTISQEVDVGNHAQVPILLLLPHQFNWLVTINDGLSSAFKVFSGSSIIGTAQQPTGINTATIQAAPTANVVALITTEPNPIGGGQYVRVEGFTLYNPSGATISDAALVARNLYDNSAFRNITVASFNGINLHVSGSCCQAMFDRITLNGGSQGGATPLKIDLAYGTNAGITFTNMSVDHPGDMLNNISITGGTTPLTASQINFIGLYMEGTTDTTHLTTPLVSINGGGRYLFSGVTVARLAGNSAAYVFDLTNTAFPTEFKVDSFGFYSDLGANTYTTGGEVVNDHIKGVTIKADANGLLPNYTSSSFGFGSNGLVVGFGTATMTTAAIAPGNCGATVTVAATGVLATDTISWAFNSPPSGNNAGLVAWPTLGNVNFAYCSNTTQTPSPATINWRVIR